MKYIKDDIEFTRAVDVLGGDFLKDGTIYSEVSDNILNGIVNFTNVIDSVYLEYTSEWNKNEEMYELLINRDNPIILEAFKDSYKSNLKGTNKYWVKFQFKGAKTWFKYYTKPNINHHTELATIDEQILLTKSKELDNTYVILWFSTGRNNIIMRFTTNDKEAVIIEEFYSWVESLNYKYHKIPNHTYKGWISSKN